MPLIPPLWTVIDHDDHLNRQLMIHHDYHWLTIIDHVDYQSFWTVMKKISSRFIVSSCWPLLVTTAWAKQDPVDDPLLVMWFQLLEKTKWREPMWTKDQPWWFHSWHTAGRSPTWWNLGTWVARDPRLGLQAQQAQDHRQTVLCRGSRQLPLWTASCELSWVSRWVSQTSSHAQLPSNCLDDSVPQLGLTKHAQSPPLNRALNRCGPRGPLYPCPGLNHCHVFLHGIQISLKATFVFWLWHDHSGLRQCTWTIIRNHSYWLLVTNMEYMVDNQIGSSSLESLKEIISNNTWSSSWIAAGEPSS